MLEQSTTTLPGRACCITPCVSTTAFTSGELGSMVKMMSAAAARLPMSGITVAPSFLSASLRAGLRFHTSSS